MVRQMVWRRNASWRYVRFGFVVKVLGVDVYLIERVVIAHHPPYVP